MLTRKEPSEVSWEPLGISCIFIGYGKGQREVPNKTHVQHGRDPRWWLRRATYHTNPRVGFAAYKGQVTLMGCEYLLLVQNQGEDAIVDSHHSAVTVWITHSNIYETCLNPSVLQMSHTNICCYYQDLRRAPLYSSWPRASA